MSEASDQAVRRLGAVPDALHLLEGIFAHLPVALQIYTADGHSLVVNQAFRELFGSEPPPEYNVLRDEIAARNGVLDLIHRAFAGETIHTPAMWYDARELRQVKVSDGRRVAIEATFFPLRGSGGQVSHVAIVFKDVTGEMQSRARLEHAGRALEAERDRLRVLADASGRLAGATDRRAALAAVVRALVPRFSDWVAVDVVGPDRRLERAALAHGDPAKEEIGRELERRFPITLDSPSQVARVARTGTPAIVARLDAAALAAAIPDPEQLRLVSALGLASFLCVPLAVRGTTIGAMSFAHAESGREFSSADVDLAEELARRVSAALDSIDSHRATQDAEQRASFLGEVSEVLSSSLDAAATMARVTRLAVPAIADTAGVYVVERDGSIRQLAVAHVDAAREPLLWELHALLPLHVSQDRLLPTVVRTGAPRLIPDLSPDVSAGWWGSGGRVAEIVRALALRSYMAVPIVVRGRVLGAIALSSAESARRFGTRELALAEELARRLGVALENSDLYEAAQRSEHRATFLSEVSDALASSIDYETTLATVARLMVPRLADWCIVDVVEPPDVIRRVAVMAADAGSQAVLEELRDRYPPSWSSPQPAGRALREAKTVLFPTFTPESLAATTRDEEHFRLLRRIMPRSAVAVPMIARGLTVGVLTFAWSQTPRTYDAADVALAEEVARRAALAVDNARLFKEAQDANRLKDEFLATVSHELRTPLQAILGWTRVLRNPTAADEKRARALETIERNAAAQTKLINDLLDIGRIVSGKLRLQIGPVDPTHVIDEAVDSVRPAAEAKQIAIDKLVDPDAGQVLGDPDRLQQVVWNLLSNAVKFTPRGGAVRVRLRRVHSSLEIVVADDGEGIPPEFLPHVFDRFRQADARSTRRHGGLGLGLAIARHLVELHGGTIGAASGGRGAGATFTVRLPLAPVQRPERPAAPDLGVATPSLDGVRVLVVEDEGDARDLIATVLNDAGATVLPAGSASEARELLKLGAPDVIVSDIGMPDEDGYTFIRRMRALPPESGGRVPALALTAYASAEDRTRALASGFTGHLPKPVEPAELLLMVANLAGRFASAPG